ncbi:hypothetical protein GMMP15_2080002 [Candidatus Magnetomoraceae bacterium gMMP-15]
MKNSTIKTVTQEIKNAVEHKDLICFRKAHFKLVNYCRRFIFEANKKVLSEIYPEISSLLMWFYRTGQPEWQKVDRLMGGLEVISSFIGNLMDSRTVDEAIEEIKKSQIDQSIVINLFNESNGILSSKLAKKLNKKQNSITNRLPALEKKGVIIRAKRGKNSIIYLTPKGRTAAEKLTEDKKDRTDDVSLNLSTMLCLLNSQTKNQVKLPEASKVYKNLYGKKQPTNETPSFWNN